MVISPHLYVTKCCEIVHKEDPRHVDINRGIWSVFFILQESEVRSVYKEVLILLAFYREVTLVDASRQQQDVFVEVSKLG